MQIVGIRRVEHATSRGFQHEFDAKKHIEVGEGLDIIEKDSSGWIGRPNRGI